MKGLVSRMEASLANVMLLVIESLTSFYVSINGANQNDSLPRDNMTELSSLARGCGYATRLARTAT